jgi:hypothetical protein
MRFKTNQPLYALRLFMPPSFDLYHPIFFSWSLMGPRPLVFQSVRLWLMLKMSLFHISSPTKGSFFFCHYLHIHAYAADSNKCFLFHRLNIPTQRPDWAVFVHRRLSSLVSPLQNVAPQSCLGAGVKRENSSDQWQDQTEYFSDTDVVIHHPYICVPYFAK